VIALGGGAIVGTENRHILQRTGIVIYLQYSFDVLFQRILDDDNRPLVSGKDRESRFKQLRELFDKREPLYERVQYSIACDPELTAELQVKKILQIIRQGDT
jgi:shikimate kinase